MTGAALLCQQEEREPQNFMVLKDFKRSHNWEKWCAGVKQRASSHITKNTRTVYRKRSSAWSVCSNYYPLAVSFQLPGKSSNCFMGYFPGRQKLHLLGSCLTLSGQGHVHVVSVKVQQDDQEMKSRFLFTGPESLPAGVMEVHCLRGYVPPFPTLSVTSQGVGRKTGLKDTLTQNGKYSTGGGWWLRIIYSPNPQQRCPSLPTRYLSCHHPLLLIPTLKIIGSFVKYEN